MAFSWDHPLLGLSRDGHMKRGFVALMATVVMAAMPLTADARIILTQGQGYPVCVTIVGALRHMSPSIDLFAWPEHLPPIHGIARPVWTPLDPLRHLDEIRAFMIQRQRQSITKFERTDDVIWAEIGPPIEADARSGKLRLEKTTVTDVKLGTSSETFEQRPWTTDIDFLRIGRLEPVLATIGSPNRPAPGRFFMDWAYAAIRFSFFPYVHMDLIDDGEGEHELILVEKQPWFVIGTVIGIPYTNDLEARDSVKDHRIYVDQRCLISF
jgi:hypothetical protein